MSCPDKGFSKGCMPEDYRSFLVLTVSLSCFSYGLYSSLTLCTLDNEQFTLNSQGSTPAIFSLAILWSLQFLTSLCPHHVSHIWPLLTPPSRGHQSCISPSSHNEMAYCTWFYRGIHQDRGTMEGCNVFLYLILGFKLF